VLSLVSGMIVDWRTGWTEGVTILLALTLLVLISSWNDWLKDRQFIKLASHSRDEEVTVVRGKLGAMQQIDIWSLVVGDVVILNAGDKVPADCIIISSSNLSVEDENSTVSQKDEKNAPFLRADSFILKGTVRAVVVCVGVNSTRGAQAKPLELRSNTPLQQKLGNLSQTFTYIGLWAAAIIFVTSTIILFIQTGVDSDVGGAIFTKKIVENFILGFIIILVAIPEGLPMTVGISLAYSVDNMFNKEKILIR
jgi:P-type E1-E2 ATPase